MHFISLSLFNSSPLHLLTFLFDLTRIRCAIPDVRCNAKLQSNNNNGAGFASFDFFPFVDMERWKSPVRLESRGSIEYCLWAVNNAGLHVNGVWFMDNNFIDYFVKFYWSKLFSYAGLNGAFVLVSMCIPFRGRKFYVF